MSGDSFGGHSSGEEVLLASRGYSLGGCCKYPKVHGTAPLQRSIWPKTSAVLRLRTPTLTAFQGLSVHSELAAALWASTDRGHCHPSLRTFPSVSSSQGEREDVRKLEVRKSERREVRFF